MGQDKWFDQIFAGPGKAPCKNCSVRDQGCHCYCIWYKEYQEIRRDFCQRKAEIRNNFPELISVKYWDEKKGKWRNK